MSGNTIIIILLIPIVFQAVYQGFKAERRHEEIKSRLDKIDKKLSGKQL